ncbi:MAG: CsbD family protein [Chthoniobacterales bacterium]
MKSSNKDKLQGALKQLSGKIKEQAGEARNDPAMKEEGRKQDLSGKIQSKAGDIKKVFNK